MEKPVRIIMFEDNEDHNTWIHTDTPVLVMSVSKGFNDDDELMIEIPHNGQWQFNSIEVEAATHKDEFDEIWNAGQAFADDPGRILKEKERQSLQEEIDKAEKLIQHYKEQLNKL